MSRYVAVADIRKALEFLPSACPYHGDRFEFLGMEHGEPRCESCRPPCWRARALRALDHVDERLITLQAESRELERVRADVTKVADGLTEMAMRAPGPWSMAEVVDERLRGALRVVLDPDTTGTVRG